MEYAHTRLNFVPEWRINVALLAPWEAFSRGDRRTRQSEHIICFSWGNRTCNARIIRKSWQSIVAPVAPNRFAEIAWSICKGSNIVARAR